MSTARHHAEWLSLVETSGPFLSMPVLLGTFPQGLDAVDSALVQMLRAAYEEWADNQGGLTPDPAIHTAWIRFVLRDILDFPDEVLAEGQAIPDSMKAVLAEHGETIRPNLMVVDPDSGKPKLLLQTYPAGQDLQKTVSRRNWKASPATRMMELLHRTEVSLGLVTNGEHWLLVAAKPGETTGYASWYASLWLEERLTLRAFLTLLGVARFFGVPEVETLPALLDASAKDQHEVTDRLGYQVRQAVEILIQAIDRADQDRGRSLLVGIDEADLYEAALTVMMRLVFLLTAEERGLLLLGEPIYDQYYAVGTLQAQLREQADQQGEEVLDRRFDAWSRLLATFRAVYGGVWHEDLRLPAYGGSLFDPDRFPFLEGRQNTTQRRGDAEKNNLGASVPPRLDQAGWQTEQADPLPISNRTVLHLLDALQLLQVKGPGGEYAARRLSFRALDIEQIGHVYEGLLDHEARRAMEPVVGLQGTKNQEPEVALSRLEAALAKGEKAIVDLLKDETGRSLSALKNGLAAELDGNEKARLRTACGNDEALYRRVLPFAGLVRVDDFGWPVVIQKGSVYVTAGATRRATGTHYTPRSLTEPIVQHTLEPLVYDGPAQGKAREDWRLRSPRELLGLKVCDMAMGSGAFLVQACRYLSERLVEAWDDVGRPSSVNREPLADNGLRNTAHGLRITPEGKPATGDPNETILPESDEERLVLARRLVVDRCLYGVDKNHLAVEMAKLSLWLVTLDKNRPFTFVDHALRHGDSLIGADEDMFLRWAHGLGDSSMPLFDQEIRRLVAEAKAKRQALQSFEVRDVGDAREKARLLAEAEAATARIKLGCDLLVGARLLDDLTKTEQDALLANGLLDYVAGEDWQDPAAARAVQAAQALPAFHWPFEFPEVLAAGGFSAFVGNPPFIGGKRISIVLSTNYASYLRGKYRSMKNTADIVACFFITGFNNLRRNGCLGLLATNTVAQGDTRIAGLEEIDSNGGELYEAESSKPWPGVASLHISIIYVLKGSFRGKKILDGQEVPYISPRLDTFPAKFEPFALVKNSNHSFIGVFVRGIGFVLNEKEANNLIKENPANVDVISPYLTGQDLNSSPNQLASRYIINFRDWSLAKSERYEECISIVRERVYPQRKKVKQSDHRKRWWQFANLRPGLHKAIENMKRVLVTARVSSHHFFDFVDTDQVFSDRLVVVAFDDYSYFAILSSTIHDIWSHKPGATTHETRSTYFPTDTFETFPFPVKSNPSIEEEIVKSGRNYHKYRKLIMSDTKLGLTDTYNRFHNPEETGQDIAHLRQLHVEMDNAVAAAYGWQDLDLGHGLHETAQGIRYTISEAARREVLTRLLKLNHQRYEEEVKAGLHAKKGRKKKAKGRKKKTPKKNDGQMSLF